jgi:hypothetical protein
MTGNKAQTEMGVMFAPALSFAGIPGATSRESSRWNLNIDVHPLHLIGPKGRNESLGPRVSQKTLVTLLVYKS